MDYNTQNTSIQQNVQNARTETIVPQNNQVATQSSLQVTNIVDLQNYAKGTIVQLPDFAEGQPFVAMVKRPSMLALAKQGKIPNSLLSLAGELFSKGGNGIDADDENMLKDMYDVCKVICEAALVNPTLRQIEETGLELTDEQTMAIFNYSQAGIKALESFR